MADPRIIVDPQDQPLVDRYAWYAEKGRNSICVVRKTRSREMGTQIRVPLSEAIMGKREGFIIDHEDGDPFNNRRRNLRYATISENNRNTKQRQSGTGLRGVRETPYRKWVARLKINGKVIQKSHDTREAAIAHRKELECAHFGKFARTA